MNEHALPDPELEQLLGAYALDALDPDERAVVDAYLDAHPSARREISRFEDVLAALATADAADPPPELWDRVQQQLRPTEELLRQRSPGEEIGPSLRLVPDGDAQAHQPSTATGPPSAGSPPSPGQPDAPDPTTTEQAPSVGFPPVPSGAVRRRRRGPISSRLRSVVLAAAAALAVVAATVAVLGRGGDGAPPSLTELAAAAERAPGAHVAAVSGDRGSARIVIDGAGNGYLLGHGLEALPDDETYQLWSLDSGIPVSLGVIGARPSVAAFAGAGVTQVALSVEPAGGSASPTLPPVAAGELRPA